MDNAFPFKTIPPFVWQKPYLTQTCWSSISSRKALGILERANDIQQRPGGSGFVINS
jgi:hypothetical protein